MNLVDRLQVLIGHEIMLTVLGDARDEEGLPICWVVPGTLREVGGDYLVIETQATKDGAPVLENGSEWQVPMQVEAKDAEQLVSLQHVTSILHIFAGCDGCAVDASSGKRVEDRAVEGG